MAEIVWEKKEGVNKKGLDKVIEHAEKGNTAPAIDDTAVIGFNSGQFFVRFPREFSDYMGLDQKKARDKKYKFKIKLDTTKYNNADMKFEGTFEVIKNV